MKYLLLLKQLSELLEESKENALLSSFPEIYDVCIKSL